MAVEFVGHGARITLHFSLKLKSTGEVIDSTFEGEPGTFDFGDGTLPGGFEGLIQGMQAGERKLFEVPPEKAFGQPNPNNIQYFKPKDFEDPSSLKPGMVFSFADAANSELPGVIKSVSEDEVAVDFNHPLAGSDLLFEVEIIRLEPSLVEEQ